MLVVFDKINRLTNVGHFQVAQTRLGNRHQRPNIELCRDEPAHRLVHITYFLVFNPFLPITVDHLSTQVI
jgi:hypothetical protein